MRLISISLLLVTFFCSPALAGGYYDSPYRSDNVIAPVFIEDEGIYNLAISIQFLNKPYDKKPYKTDNYEKFIQRLSVEWSNAALDTVLNSKISKMEQLPKLKSDIEAEISTLANQLKSKYSLKQDVEIVFTLSNFYLVYSKE